ncbi:MAG: hypothetical protein R3C68_11650 [Myxococcota bacterium]
MEIQQSDATFVPVSGSTVWQVVSGAGSITPNTDPSGARFVGAISPGVVQVVAQNSLCTSGPDALVLEVVEAIRLKLGVDPGTLRPGARATLSGEFEVLSSSIAGDVTFELIFDDGIRPLTRAAQRVIMA